MQRELRAVALAGCTQRWSYHFIGRILSTSLGQPFGRSVGELAALASALCWAGTSVGMAQLSVRYRGAVLSGLRFLIASPCIIALALITGSLAGIGQAPWTAIAAVVGSAVIGYGIGDTTYVAALPRVGLQRMAPTSTALWVALSAAGGALVFGEALHPALLVGGAAVIAGTYLVIRGRSGQVRPGTVSRAPGALATLVLIVAVAGAWTVATLLLAFGRGSLGAVATAAMRIPIGALAVAAISTVTHKNPALRSWPMRADVPLLLAIGILGTAVGTLLYIYSVGVIGVARATILNSTSPLMVVPLSMLFLGERLTLLVGAGTALCVVGTLVVILGR
jgi:drug/metabolite transporter (DMT)-like permease